MNQHRKEFEQHITGIYPDKEDAVLRWEDQDDVEGEYLNETTQKLWEMYDNKYPTSVVFALTPEGDDTIEMEMKVGYQVDLHPNVQAMCTVLQHILSNDVALAAAARSVAEANQQTKH